MKVSLGFFLNRSNWIQLLLVAVFLLCIAQTGVNYILTYDVFGYYLYLPATFIYQDPFFTDLSWVNTVVDTYNNSSTVYQLNPTPSGGHEVKYSVGLSILMLPFFFLGHLHAYLIGAPIDGFSAPYNLWINIGYWTYAFFSVVLLRKTLTIKYDSLSSALTLLVLFLGSNLMHQIYGAVGMPHVYVFFLYSLLLFLLTKSEQNRTAKNAMSIGLTFGLLIMCRPTEFLAFVLIALWYFKNPGLFKYIMSEKSHHLKYWLTFAFSASCVLFIQLLRWKLATGSWYYMGYQNNGEGFDLFPPHLLDFLFSFRKGWLLYSPLMALALIGLIYIPQKRQRAALVAFVFLEVLIISSWSNWWYSESFGNRGIVQIYAPLSIGLGALIFNIKGRSRTLKWTMGILIFLCVSLNLFQTYQFAHGLIHSSRMTKQAYKEVFLALDAPSNFSDLLLPDWEKWKGLPIDTSKYELFDSLIGPSDLALNSDQKYAEILSTEMQQIASSDFIWVELEATLVANVDNTHWPLSVLSIAHKGEYANQFKEFDADQVNTGDTLQFYDKYLTPEPRMKNDRLKVYFWMMNDGNATVLHSKVRFWKRKSSGDH